MKSTPKREPDANFNTAAATQAANELTTLTAKPERPEHEQIRLVSIRLKETDYKRLKGLYGGQGLSLSAGMKMSAFYLADMVEQGAFALSAGGYIDRRK
jgi:hypothetical protein